MWEEEKFRVYTLETVCLTPQKFVQVLVVPL